MQRTSLGGGFADLAAVGAPRSRGRGAMLEDEAFSIGAQSIGSQGVIEDVVKEEVLQSFNQG